MFLRDEALRFSEFFQLISLSLLFYNISTRSAKCLQKRHVPFQGFRLDSVCQLFLFSAELMQEDFSVDDLKDIKVEMYSKY